MTSDFGGILELARQLVTEERGLPTRCDFCGKTRREVRGMVEVCGGAWPRICNERVGIVVQLAIGAYP